METGHFTADYADYGITQIETMNVLSVGETPTVHELQAVLTFSGPIPQSDNPMIRGDHVPFR
jgi:hypothetical protein